MTAPLRVSVVVVSHHRPEALKLCLTALARQDHPAFEIIVAADAQGLSAAQTLPFFDALKTVQVDQLGISNARNAGVQLAGGAVVAFIDDDAVAPPVWLSRLTAPFGDPLVAAAGGFVRGRNGISYQWKARVVDLLARHQDLALPEDQTTLHPGAPGRAIRTEGTNMAVRRDALERLGGFDPAYRFYLDETDLNIRLAAEHAMTAIVPTAQVVHGIAASAWRGSDRVPRSLFDVGASTAIFLRRHAAPADRSAALDQLRGEQRRRLLRHMVSGGLEPRDVTRLMRDLDAGITQGMTGPLPPRPVIQPAPGFAAFPGSSAATLTVLAGRWWQGRSLRHRARTLVSQGEQVLLLLFTRTSLFHRFRLHPDGYWEQRGGQFGRSDRKQRLFRPWRLRRRVTAETARAARFLGLTAR
ncbi:glycosyltransferase family 2 protein [Actibacterium sp.]|uniref:glycosyltransferase family 2 protein n=1 Tax=Actibacterium sp. TaxID=1872125 RepID=UPI003565C468